MDDNDRDLFVSCVTDLALENKGEVHCTGTSIHSKQPAVHYTGTEHTVWCTQLHGSA